MRDMADQLGTQPQAVRHARAYKRARVSRQAVADALIDFYDSGEALEGAEPSFYRGHLGLGGPHLDLSILTAPKWLDAAVELGTPAESFEFVPPPQTDHTQLSPLAIHAALQRLAEVETTETVLVNNPLYRLLDVEMQPGYIAATLTSTDFLTYALTADLLEAELVQALAEPQRPRAHALAERLPLRRLYLPTTTAALELRARNCVGGPAALLAIARAATAHHGRDYVLVVQERSPRVLNVTGKLAVIPKAFHQPLVEQAGEVALSMTLQRELEEELLGRQDLEDLSPDAQRRADPLHVSSQSEAMRWLYDRRNTPIYRVECVGFGLNMVTGNYEFPSLIVIEDEEWWDRYGHEVEANWETMRTRRYSSLDRRGLVALATDPTWSNEGLFAFLEGLKRLSRSDVDGRVAAPLFEVEF